MTLPGPLPIADYFDALRRDGLEIVPGSFRWLPDPKRAGRMVAGFAVRAVREGAMEREAR